MKRSTVVACLFALCVFSLGAFMAAPLVEQAHADGAAMMVGVSADADAHSALKQQAVKRYSIWVGGKQVTSKNAKNVLGNGTVTYNAKTNTLTLKNARIKGAHVSKNNDGGVYRNGIHVVQAKGLTIVLKGKNSVSTGGKADVGNYGIAVEGTSASHANLTVKGAGSLKVQAGKAGLFGFGIVCWNLNVKGSATLVSYGGTKVSTSRKPAWAEKSAVGSRGVYTMGTTTLGGSAKLIAYGKNQALVSAPSFASGYSPQVKAGMSAKSIKVNKKKPTSSVYTKYKYVQISKAKKSSSASSQKPAKVSISSVEGVSRGVRVVFTMPAKACSHYRVQVSEYSTFNAIATWTSNVNSTSPKSKIGFTFTGFASGLTYYVRVQAINQSGSKTYYGPWSTVKTFTAK